MMNVAILSRDFAQDDSFVEEDRLAVPSGGPQQFGRNEWRLQRLETDQSHVAAIGRLLAF
jgi:hypothetical protein